METNRSVYETLIRESFLDSFGHVNNAKYLELFEAARWELITAHGYGLEKILQIKQGPVILEIKLKFKKELRLREKIRIETYVTAYRGKIGNIRQEIFNEAGQLAAVGDFMFGLFDLTARKLIAPTPEWLKAIRADQTFDTLSKS